MDINSFVTGFSMGKKKGGSGGGGKDPVLTELTVTENGVYDEPMIGGLEPIIWDGTIGDKPFVELEPGTGAGYVKISDTTPSLNDLAEATFTLASGESFNPNGDTSIFEEVPGMGIFMKGDALLVMLDQTAATESGFPGTGTYVFYAPSMSSYITSIVFATLDPTPADGWNKVTVNVVGDIIDIDELPTQHALQNKVYRVTNGDAVTYGITSNATVKRLVDGAWVELT